METEIKVGTLRIEIAEIDREEIGKSLEMVSDLTICPDLREVKVRLAETLLQVFRSRFCEGICVDVGRAFGHLLEGIVRFAFCEIAQGEVGGFEELFDVALFVEGEVAAEDVDGVVAGVCFLEQPIDFEAFSRLGRHGFCLANGIHDAFGELDGGETVTERAVDIREVAAEKMVDTSGEDEDGGWELCQASQDVGDAFDEEGFLVGGVEVAFAELEGVEAAAVGVSHFGGGEDDAAQAAGGADVDLVGVGDEHAGVDDVPGAAGGGGVLEGVGEGGRTRRFCDWNRRIR